MSQDSEQGNWNSYILALGAGLFYLVLVCPPVTRTLQPAMQPPILYFLMTALVFVTFIFILASLLGV